MENTEVKKPINPIRRVENEDGVFYVRKGFFGVNVVYPVQKDITKPIVEKKPFKVNWDNINWKHLIAGKSWWNLFFIIFCLAIAIGFMFEYYTNTKLCADVMADINEYRIVNNPTRLAYQEWKKNFFEQNFSELAKNLNLTNGTS